jgi:hypothetical protein
MRCSANVFLSFIFLGILSPFADACVLNGPRYQLASDTVRWSLKLSAGETCIRGVRFNNVVVNKLTVVSAPQTGHVTLQGPGFSYKAARDFEGSDFFSLVVSGATNKVPGSSAIEVEVSVTRADELRRFSTMISPSSQSEPSPPLPAGSPTSSPPLPPPVNDLCGSSNDVAASSAPTTNLCSTASQPFTVTGVEKPGPSSYVYTNQPYYSCTSNRYVATTGSSSNNGTSPSIPWDFATAIRYSAPAGTCINVAAGVYNVNRLGPRQINIAHGGTGPTKTGYVVWRCTTMPFSFLNGVLQGEGNGCVIKNVGGTPQKLLSFNTNVTFFMLDGFEFDGGAGQATTCVDQETDITTHHLWILNSDIHDCGLAGIGWNNTDWLFVIHNVVHDNAYVSGFMGSGISIFEPVQIATYTPTAGNPDYWHSNTTGFTYDIVVAYNVTYHNYNGLTNSTDGNGIIFDDFHHDQQACPGAGTCPWAGNALAMGNIMYNNGGGGIKHAIGNNLGNETIVNNTAYANFWDTTDSGIYRGNFYLDPGTNNSVFNNVSYATGSGGGVSNQPFLGQNCGGSCGPNSGNTWQTNISYPGGLNGFDGTTDTYPTVGTNKNIDGSDPKFVGSLSCSSGTCAGNPNFALQATSPAIGFGQGFDLWQQSGTVDSGACPSTLLTACP